MLTRDLRLVILGALTACSLSKAGIAPPGGASQDNESSATSSAGAGGGSAASDWWDRAFSQRIRITFQNDSGEELTDFPVLVKLNADRIEYGAASQTGADLRFVDADGKTLLAHELDRWSTTTGGDSFVWVRVPKIDGASGADHMWLYYGNPGATDAQAATTVWAGFIGVYHLSPSATDLKAIVDSTGTYRGGWYDQIGSNIPGMIGDAVDLDGSQFVEVGDIDDFSVGPDQGRTVEVWFNPRVSREQYVVYQEGQCRGWFVGMDGQGNYTGHLTTANDTDVCGSYNNYLVTAPEQIGTWRYVTLVMDRLATQMRLLVNGVVVSSHFIDSDKDADGAGFFRIGADWDETNPFSGLIDEVRVSSSARSNGWIAAQHRSMTDGFLRFDRE
jgi:hypothetical protein